MLLDDVARTSAEVAATSRRTEKRDRIAALLAGCSAAEVPVVVAVLVGEPLQGRIGVGHRTLERARAGSRPAGTATLTVTELDAALDALSTLSGAGSGTDRLEHVTELFGRSTPREADLLVRLLGGDLRQGASTGVMVEAVAAAWDVPATAVRRAVMLGGSLPEVASIAVAGGAAAVADVRLELGRPIQPMLAATAPSVADALEARGTASVEWKLDGIRIQVHRRDDEVRVWTRNLNDVTARLPGVVAAVRSLRARHLLLDGEALAVGADGRPAMFQDTVRNRDGDEEGLVPHFFDVLHVDGRDLIDEPLTVRAGVLAEVAHGWRVPSVVTDDPRDAAAVLDEALAAGHEGVVVKDVTATYQAGRRGTAWRKVKPVHTLDLVVLAAEWGHGRRTGWLSNLHLGARARDGDGFVMVGKTFKGLTDDLLRRQTERFAELADDVGTAALAARRGTVSLRPVQVVEVAVDGVQRSTRYPGGVALRFARVVRHRDDKAARDADTIDAVRALRAGADSAGVEEVEDLGVGGDLGVGRSGHDLEQ